VASAHGCEKMLPRGHSDKTARVDTLIEPRPECKYLKTNRGYNISMSG
jgi:hypothetical protein